MLTTLDPAAMMTPFDLPGRIVTKLPLTDLWDGSGLVRALRAQDIGSREVAELMRTLSVNFVVAEVGARLCWVPESDRYYFWRAELRPHLAEPTQRRVDLCEFPGHYCYLASEWHQHDGPICIVLEKFN